MAAISEEEKTIERVGLYNTNFLITLCITQQSFRLKKQHFIIFRNEICR